MRLTKKQMNAFLNVLSNDESREILTQAAICEYEKIVYLVATDSYKLCALQLTDDLKDLVGKRIEKSELIKWYKLADHKSMFTEDDVRELATDLEKPYPKWQDLMPEAKDLPQACTSVFVDPNHLVTMAKLSETTGLLYEFHGHLGGQLVSKLGGNIYVVMGLKK